MAVDNYLKNAVMTASPYDLHLMVVDGAVRYAKFAMKSLEGRDFEKAHLALAKSREFVTELISGLKEDRQPELVQLLKARFQLAWKALVQADFDHKPENVGTALTILESHRETWRELGAMLKSATETGQAANSMAPPDEPPAANTLKKGPHWTQSSAPVRVFKTV